MKHATSFGGLVEVKTGAHLRRGGRQGGPKGIHAASCTSSRLRVLALGGTLALAAWLFVSTDAHGAPGPDPYKPSATTPQAPAPDPYRSSHSASTERSSPAPSPSPAPAPVASGGSSAVVERQSVTPKQRERATPQKRQNRQQQPVVRGPQPETSRTAIPPAVVKPELNASAAVAAVSASPAWPLAVGGLALLLLAVASGSLVALVTRDHSWRAEA